MQQGRVSTIRFNEWICVCAQYEKAVARIGRQVYQGYSRGLISDFHTIELCKEISQCFTDSKKIRAEMEEELERDALHGLSVEESKAAEELMELTSSQKMMRNAKLQMTKLMGRGAVNRSLQAYRNRVVELSRDLGLRALAMHTKEPLLKMEGHLRLCHLAVKLDEDSNKKWEEITAAKTDKGGGVNISFHTMLISFVANFANFSRGTAIGKMLLKVMRYDSKEEEKKLTKQFEGSKTADALVAQMSEVEEPDLDIGREMATMEREYVETPTDWGLPPRAATESWIPDTSDNWAPDPADEPKAKPAPSPPTTVEKPKPATAAADGPKPQVLRQRRQPEPFKGAEAWVAGSGENEPESWAPPPAAPTRIGQAPAAKAVSEPEEDWATETDGEEDEQEAPAARPRLGGATSAPVTEAQPPRPPATPQLGGAMPPKPQPRVAAAPETFPPAPAAPVAPPTPAHRPAAAEPPLPPLPPLPARPIRSLDIPIPVPIPKPEAPKPPAPAPLADDPLLRLLRPEPVAELKNDDDLLPAFLRERSDEDSLDSSSFIPDLPDSVDSGLKIIPFGSQPNKADEPLDTFIPKMPD
jgi:hypothetical protein